jgi:hypothetical protein
VSVRILPNSSSSRKIRVQSSFAAVEFGQTHAACSLRRLVPRENCRAVNWWVSFEIRRIHKRSVCKEWASCGPLARPAHGEHANIAERPSASRYFSSSSSSSSQCVRSLRKASRSKSSREWVAGSAHDVPADLPSIALTDYNPSVMATVAADSSVTLIIATPRSG